MKQFFIKGLTTLYFLQYHLLYAENISLYASFFNATYSCNNPLVLNGNVTIYLDEDIVINGCIPFVAGPLLQPEDQLIFTSQNNHNIIIKANTIVEFATFLPQSQSVIITGNARLIIEKGAHLIFNNNILTAKQNGYIHFIESSP